MQHQHQDRTRSQTLRSQTNDNTKQQQVPTSFASSSKDSEDSDNEPTNLRPPETIEQHEQRLNSTPPTARMLRSSGSASSLTDLRRKSMGKDKIMPSPKHYDPVLSYAQGAWDKMTNEDKMRAIKGADERNLSSYDKIPFDSAMEKKQKKQNADRASHKVEGITEDEMKDDFEEMGIPWTEPKVNVEQGKLRSARLLGQK